MATKMRTIDEKEYQALVVNEAVVISPHIINRPRRGGVVVKRKLDGQEYDIQPYKDKIRTLSVSQLRGFATKYRDGVRGKAIRDILIEKGALRKGGDK